MPIVLSASQLSKCFGSTRALESFSLDISADEAVVLMGANGAGKSTFVKILCGIHQADHGVIRLRDEEISFGSPRQARLAGVIAVHQSIIDAGMGTLSVADNLLLDRYCTVGSSLFILPQLNRAEASAIARLVDLDVDLDARLDALSIADRQLVAIASAVAHNPTVMIFDEPTASLSAKESQRLFEVIDRLKARGVAILYISHKISDLQRIADRVVVICDGRLSGSFDAPVDFAAAIRAMIGRDIAKRDTATARTGKQRVLTLSNVRLRSDSRPFDLDVYADEVLAITGPVGAGKTSLADALFGLWSFAEGEVELNGQPWHPRSPRESVHGGVFLAGEDRWRTTFFPETVTFANIAGTISFPFLSRWSKAALVPFDLENRVADHLIRLFGIKARGPEDMLGALSGGNQQKVVLARWHAEPARLLLLDEPFQGVDIGARNDIIRAIRENSIDRATIVFVNDLEEALEVADRVIVMTQHTIEPVCEDGANEIAALIGSADEPAPSTQH